MRKGCVIHSDVVSHSTHKHCREHHWSRPNIQPIIQPYRSELERFLFIEEMMSLTDSDNLVDKTGSTFDHSIVPLSLQIVKYIIILPPCTQLQFLHK